MEFICPKSGPHEICVTQPLHRSPYPTAIDLFAVLHRQPGTPTRWGLLIAYRTPDLDASPTKWTNGIPAHWVERAAAEGRRSSAARRVLEADNPLD